MTNEPKTRYHVYYSTTKGWRAMLARFTTLEEAKHIAKTATERHGRATRVVKMVYKTEVVEEYGV